jgi:hypothetical protein
MKHHAFFESLEAWRASITPAKPVYGISFTQTRQLSKKYSICGVDYLIQISQEQKGVVHHALFLLGKCHDIDRDLQKKLNARADRAWDSVRQYCRQEGLQLLSARIAYPTNLTPTITYLPPSFYEEESPHAATSANSD